MSIDVGDLILFLVFFFVIYNSLCILLILELVREMKGIGKGVKLIYKKVVKVYVMKCVFCRCKRRKGDYVY